MCHSCSGSGSSSGKGPCPDPEAAIVVQAQSARPAPTVWHHEYLPVVARLTERTVAHSATCRLWHVLWWSAPTLHSLTSSKQGPRTRAVFHADAGWLPTKASALRIATSEGMGRPRGSLAQMSIRKSAGSRAMAMPAKLGKDRATSSMQIFHGSRNKWYSNCRVFFVSARAKRSLKHLGQ